MSVAMLRLLEKPALTFTTAVRVAATVEVLPVFSSRSATLSLLRGCPFLRQRLKMLLWERGPEECLL